MKLRKEEMRIINPWLVALYFYKRGNPNDLLPDSLTSELSLVKDEAGHKTFRGSEYQLEWLPHYDINVLRLSLGETKEFSFKTQFEPPDLLNTITKTLEIPVVEGFLGSSILYWGLVDSLEGEDYGTAPPTKNEFGNLWQAQSPEGGVEKAHILLTPKALEEKTKNFLFATDWGFLKIESHFHRSEAEIREYDKIREELMGCREELDKEPVALLSAFSNQDIQKQREELNAMTPRYMAFVGMVSQVNQLKNSLQINLTNYQERLEILRMEKDYVYAPHIKRFERSLIQMKYDLNYCQSTITSVNTGLDLLRGINSIATHSTEVRIQEAMSEVQRRGVTIQEALSVVEVIFVFYYSLGVWHFIIEKEDWGRISSINKLMVGLCLSVFVPLGTHFLMRRKWWKFGISLAAVLGTVIYAVYLTCII